MGSKRTVYINLNMDNPQDKWLFDLLESCGRNKKAIVSFAMQRLCNCSAPMPVPLPDVSELPQAIRAPRHKTDARKNEAGEPSEIPLAAEPAKLETPSQTTEVPRNTAEQAPAADVVQANGGGAVINGVRFTSEQAAEISERAIDMSILSEKMTEEMARLINEEDYPVNAAFNACKWAQ